MSREICYQGVLCLLGVGANRRRGKRECVSGRIGIVACSAPGAAMCYEIICTEGPALISEENSHPEVSLHTHPYSKYLSRVEAGDWQGVAELMLSSAEKLASLGAELLIAPCNTVHLAYELVAPRSPLPWLHIAEEVALVAGSAGYRRVGVLGTKLVMESPIYRDRLEHLGIECSIPGESDRERVNCLLFEEMAYGRFTPGAQEYFLEIIGRLQGEGCDAVGLCCTEIPILLRGAEASLPILDSDRKSVV
jgi:aspartate racemase